jgi:hypothetical protein
VKKKTVTFLLTREEMSFERKNDLCWSRIHHVLFGASSDDIRNRQALGCE